MRKIHQNLVSKYSLYRVWHENPLHHVLHWFAFIFLSIAVTFSLQKSIKETVSLQDALYNLSSISSLEAATVTVGPSSPGTVESDSTNGGTVAWQDPSNAQSSNNQNATANLSTTSETTQYLKASNFGFAIPDTGTITGIKVQIEKGETCSCTVSDVEVKLLKSGSVTGDNKAIAGNWPATGSGGSRYYGTASNTVDSVSTDLWGTTWTPAEINSSGFGVVLSAKENSDAATSIIVDMIRITVYYDDGGAGGGDGGGGGGGGGTPTSDTTPPVVSITSPAEAATISGTVNIAANASDETGVAGVQFQIDGNNIGTEDTTVPYDISWDTSSATNATHTIAAIARDTSGNQTTSTLVSVTVNNSSGGGNPNPPPSGLVGYWNFNEGTGSSAFDSSGNSNTGTLTNNPTWTTGKLGGALQFDGVDDKVVVGDVSSLDLSGNALTLSAWIYTDGTDTKQFPYIMGKVNTNNNYVMYLSNTAMSATMGLNTGALTNCAKTSFAHNQWNLVTTTYDGANISIYVNGALKGTCAKTGNIVPNNDPFIIGDKGNGSNNPNPFKGKIDDVRVYNTALSASEVLALYNEVPADGGDTTPPAVSLTAPSASATISNTTTVSATASDNIAVARVQFKLDGVNIGAEDTSSPYSISWDTTTTTNGVHLLTAVAHDSAGNSAVSASVSVTVNNIITTPPPSANNTVKIVEKAGVTTVNYPVQIGRPFVQGEILNYPKVLLNGTPVFTQADIKQRWSDGSVKHAILSFLIPNFAANSTINVTFQNQATGNNTALTANEMLDAKYNFDAKIEMTSGGVTKTASARTMLQNGDYTLWTSGPVATTVILVDHSLARKYDLGFDSYKPFRPIFHATFWPTIDKVRVRYIGELANTEEFEDISLTSLNLKIGNTSPLSVYSKSSFVMYAGSRWTKEYWIGSAPSSINTDFNLKYLASTKFIPNYDPTKVVSESSILDTFSAKFNSWTNTLRDLYDPGMMKKSMGTTGGRPEIGPYPDWVVKWLYTGDNRMKEVAFGHADLSAAWPIHFREGSSTKKMDAAGQVSGVGKVVSIKNRPSLRLSKLDYVVTKTEDKVKVVGAVTNGGWNPDMAHSFDMWSPLYASSGDFWHLEELWFWTAYGAGESDGIAGAYPYRRSETGAVAGLTGQLRGKAWVLRTRVNSTFVTPDGTPEKDYFTTLVNDAISIEEGYKNITTTSNYQNANWTWARNFINSSNPLGVPPLGQWDKGNSNLAQASYGIDETITSEAVSGFEQGFMMFSLGRAKELGFATDKIVSYLAKFYIGLLTDSGSNPYLIQVGRIPTIRRITSTYFDTWTLFKTGYDAVSQALSSFPLQDPVHGYDFIGLAATSMVANEPGGGPAWTFMKEKVLSAPILNDNPKWAIIPRSDTFVPPVSDTQAPSIPANVVLSPAGSSIALSWSASTDDVGVTGYKIFRGGVQIGSSPITSFLDNDPSLVPGQDYTYTVSAYDLALNNSAQSSSATGKLTLNIDSFTATSVNINTGDSTTLSWVVKGANAISINQGVGVVTTIDGVGTRVVNPSTTTTYTLTAISGSKSVTKDITITVTNPPPPPPNPGDITPPEITNIKAGKVGWTRVEITWDTDELSDGQVEYGTSTSYGNVTNINPVFSRTKSFAISKLLPGRVYNFRVKSKDSSGNLRTSTNLTFSTSPRLAKPPKLTALVLSEGSINLSWSPVNYEDLCKSIDIYRNTDEFLTSPVSADQLVSLDCGQTAYIDLEVEPSTTYFYTIFVIDDQRVRSDPTTSEFTTKADTNPVRFNNRDNTVGFTPPSDDDKEEDESTCKAGEKPFDTESGKKCMAEKLTKLEAGCSAGYKFNTINGKPCPIESDTKNMTSGKYNFGTETLRQGSRGEAVKELQRFLNYILKMNLVLDGILGPKTVTIIKEWQKANSLTPDGLVGPKTKKLMNESVNTNDEEVISEEDTKIEEPISSVSGKYNFGTEALRQGSRGEAVKELQRFLNKAFNLSLPVDGSFGSKTSAIVKKWQKDNNLIGDGVVGSKTKSLMNSKGE